MIITKYALKKATNDIQSLYKSEVYSPFWLVLFSPSQNSAKKIIFKTDNETYRNSLETSVQDKLLYMGLFNMSEKQHINTITTKKKHRECKHKPWTELE